jgi:MraZ protein
VFRGVNGIHSDAKGRIVIPARYRQSLEESQHRVILTIDTEERCLLLYPLTTWELIEAQLAELPSFNPSARRIQRLLIGHATEVELDRHGRILLPPLLREYANLTKNIMLVGQGKKIELWDETHWDERRQQWLAEEADNANLLPDEVKNLSL